MLLPSGRFCIIPCTYKQGDEAEFLLRVFVEKNWGSSECGRGHAVNDAMDGGQKTKERYSPDATDGATADFGQMDIGKGQGKKFK